MKHTNSTRRDFLKTSAVAAATVSLPTLIPRSALAQDGTPGANDRIGVAGIGIGRQGIGVLAAAVKNKATQPICVCDLYLPRAEANAKKVDAPDFCDDYRKVLDRKDVDAIVTATPDHWRSLVCVNAALAGKHIYGEKPISLTIDDGKLMLKAARKTNIVFQCGSMQRSYRENHLACRMIQEGKLGKIKEIIGWNYESPWLCGLPAQEIPTGLDWDRWCGPTEPVPFNKDIFTPRANPGWISFRPYSGGEMTGWGTHGFDQIQCALQMDSSGPVEILVEGDKLEPPTYTEAESRPRGDKLCSVPRLKFRYANGITVTLDKGNRAGGIFIGENGKMEIGRRRINSNPKEIVVDYFEANKDFKMESHVDNWISCILSGKRPIGDIESGHRSASICHLLNIARFVGRSLKWDPEKEVFIGDDEANGWLSRKHRKGYELPEV